MSLDPQRIIQTMKSRGYTVDVGDDLMNIVYIEGMNLDGSLNGKRVNYWDDLRTLIRVHANGQAELLGAWEATTEPGVYWTDHPMNPDGAFHIDLGQQSAWSLGQYHNREALTQSRPLHGTRSALHHYARDGKPDSGMFGVHHHSGYDYPKNDIGNSSAGCQVGRTVAGHLEFMKLIHTDARMQTTPERVWTSTVMPCEWLSEAPAPIYVLPDHPPAVVASVPTNPEGRPLLSSLWHLFGGLGHA